MDIWCILPRQPASNIFAIETNSSQSLQKMFFYSNRLLPQKKFLWSEISMFLRDLSIIKLLLRASQAKWKMLRESFLSISVETLPNSSRSQGFKMDCQSCSFPILINSFSLPQPKLNRSKEFSFLDLIIKDFFLNFTKLFTFYSTPDAKKQMKTDRPLRYQ